MNQRFALAPMSGMIYVLTVGFVPWPFVALAGSFFLPDANVRKLFFGIAIVLGLIWASVWYYWRPTAFVVGPDGLTIEFPLRTLTVSRHMLAGAFEMPMSWSAVRERYGAAARVGAGGLWGGFGWLWTQKRGMVDLYVSHTRGAVIVERKNGKDLVLTPERPDEFIAALNALART